MRTGLIDGWWPFSMVLIVSNINLLPLKILLWTPICNLGFFSFFSFTVMEPSWSLELFKLQGRSVAQCFQSITLDCWLRVFSIKFLNSFFNKNGFITDLKKPIHLAKSDKHCLGKETQARGTRSQNISEDEVSKGQA